MRRATLTLTLVVTALAVTANAAETVYQRTLRSTVWIITDDSSGSGVLVDVDEKLVVTNFHVVGETSQVLVFFPRYEGQELIAERDRYVPHLRSLSIAGTVISCDPKRDLAVIQLQSVPQEARPCTLAESSAQPGQRVHSIGNPVASEALWVYTSGTVRQVYHKTMSSNGNPIDARIVETQSPLNPGDSGGPVVNEAGELVAISQSIHRDADLVSNNIDVSEVKSLLAGEIKTIDQRVLAGLDAAKWNYETNLYGVFRLGFGPAADQARWVYVNSATTQIQPIEIREIWSVARVFQRQVPPRLTSLLLKYNHRYALGAWELRPVGDELALVFCARIDGSCDAQSLIKTVEVVVRVVADMEETIVQELSRAAVSRATVIGRWRGVTRDERGDEVEIVMSLGGDGAFSWRDPFSDFRGRYELAGAALDAIVAGTSRRLGTLQAVGQDQMVLTTESTELTFVRVSNTEETGETADVQQLARRVTE